MVCTLPAHWQCVSEAGIQQACICIWLLTQLIIIIIMLPNQAIASMPSALRPSGAEGRGSTAPLCLQLLRTSQLTQLMPFLVDAEGVLSVQLRSSAVEVDAGLKLPHGCCMCIPMVPDDRGNVSCWVALGSTLGRSWWPEPPCFVMISCLVVKEHCWLILDAPG
jgi:hypothetical protein